MASLNKVMLIGNITRDPQVKQIAGGTTVAEFGLAVNRKYRTSSGEEREDVCFVDCAAFGKQGEVIGQYCQKGKLMYLEGRLKLDQWDDKQSGAKRSKLSVIVENFQFLGGRDSGEGNGSGTQQRPQAQGRPQRPAANSRAGSPFGEEQHFTEADIPF